MQRRHRGILFSRVPNVNTDRPRPLPGHGFAAAIEPGLQNTRMVLFLNKLETDGVRSGFEITEQFGRLGKIAQ